MNPTYHLQVCDPTALLNDCKFLQDWERLLAARSHPNILFASPAWISHLIQKRELVHIWCVRDSVGTLKGIVPVQIGTFELQFAVSNRTLAARRLQVGRILGSLPLVPDCEDLYRELFRAVLDALPSCVAIHCDALPTESFLSRLIVEKKYLGPACYVHVVDGPRPWHLVELSTFDDYLKSMSSKARANVRREVRTLQTLAGGKLELRSCELAEQVPSFLRDATEVSQRSWQHRVLGTRVAADDSQLRAFTDLAERGLLRSYLLVAGDSPCAFVIGYQFRGVYHYAEVGFDAELSKYSPGTVLLFLILEDLHRENQFTTLNFGIGDATYKRRFGNCERSDIGCLFMRRTLSSRLLTTSHGVFNSLVRAVKSLLNRRVTK